MTAPATRNAPAPFTPTQFGTVAGAGNKEELAKQAMAEIVRTLLGSLHFKSNESSEEVGKRIYKEVRGRRERNIDPISAIAGGTMFQLTGAFASHKSGKTRTHVGIRIKSVDGYSYTEDRSLDSLVRKIS